jgi:hypothetical protein
LQVLRAEGRADTAEAQCKALEVLLAEGKAENAALKDAIAELEASLSESKVYLSTRKFEASPSDFKVPWGLTHRRA